MEAAGGSQKRAIASCFLPAQRGRKKARSRDASAATAGAMGGAESSSPSRSAPDKGVHITVPGVAGAGEDSEDCVLHNTTHHGGDEDAGDDMETLTGAGARRSTGKGKKRAAVEPNLKLVQKRVLEFGRDQGLVQALEGHLYCNFCAHVLEESSTAVKRHLVSDKHRRNTSN